MKSNYELIDANEGDFEFVKNAKITTIFEYAKNISDKERKNMLSYVDRVTEKHLRDYKIISHSDKKCGVFLIRDYDDGVLLDEIYLMPEYRNLGIGSDIIKNEIIKHNKVYLWVYKENVRAVDLYKKLGFGFVKEDGERYLMLYEKKCNN